MNRISFYKLIIAVFIIILSAFLIFIFFEYFRSWQSVDKNESFLSTMFDYFVVPYLAKNHDNALIFFDSPISYNLFNSIPIFRRVFSNKIDLDIDTVVDIGPHATVLMYAMFYQDFGLISLLFVFISVMVISHIYILAIETMNLRYIILYAICIPGLLSICRSPYFGSVAFLTNLICYFIIKKYITYRII